MNATTAPTMRAPMLIPATAPELSPLPFPFPEFDPAVITAGSGWSPVKDGLAVGCWSSGFTEVVLEPVFAGDVAVVVRVVA